MVWEGETNRERSRSREKEHTNVEEIVGVSCDAVEKLRHEVESCHK